MREIKFRAYCKATGKWYDRVLASNYEDGPCSIVWDEDKKEWLNHDGPIAQYTGLQCKNGNEIYEGDILRLKVKYSWRSEKEGFHYITSAVEWWESSYLHGYRLRNKSRHMMIKPSSLKTMEAEVIGNIYEHPHLLEVQK